MSGQAGIYYYDHRPIDRGLADRLTAGLSRQGPDGGGEHFGEGLLMVYRAFTFDALSRRERQPYVLSSGNCITFDGRLDNRDDLLLLVKDHLQDDTSDVALAMAAYEKWGEQGFNRLIGDWSLALWDEARRSVLLASDYMGVRPLFYFEGDGFVTWSSDLTLLSEWMGLVDEFDNYYIAAFLTGSPKYDRTVYRGIWYVSCGHTISFSLGAQTKTEFWKPPVENRFRYRDDSDYEEQLLHLFREAVLARLRTDGPVCCDLSGGLDSSAVTCMAQHLITAGTVSVKRLITYSQIDHSMDDLRYIPVVESHCGISGIHCDCPPTWSLKADAEPFPRHGTIFRVQKSLLLRQQNVRVNLTGVGGDLVMGNTLEDFEQLSDYLRRGALWPALRSAYEWSRALHLPVWWVLKFGSAPLLPARIQQRLLRQKSDLFSVAYHHLQKTSHLNQEFIARYENTGCPKSDLEYRKAIPSQRTTLFGSSEYRAEHALGAYTGPGPIQTTHPYCHRPLVEYVVSIPRDQLCGPHKPRDLMRRAFAALLPREVLARRSKALASFLSDLSLQELAAELLQAPGEFRTEVAGYAKPGALRRILEHPQDQSYKRDELHQLVTLEVWLRTRTGLVSDRPAKKFATSS